MPLTPLIGREEDRLAVRAALAGARLLTLTGAGGCGKTRLALAVATDLLAAYPDGVRLVELAALGDPALVAGAVAGAFGIRDQPGRPPVAALVATLRDSAPLLLLDNCEHLVATCAGLAVELLAACPRLQILATSREPLGLPGETTWRVPSLRLPAGDPLAGDLPGDLAALAQVPAVRLFIDRARSRRPAFALTPENAGAVAEICRRLDGVPLAIELAAARAGTLGVGQVAARLDDALHTLGTGGRAAPPRQQTLRATLDWSHGLLAPAEQIVFRRLAAFAGGWSLDAAEAVCADPPGDGGIVPEGIIDLLAALVEKSLAAIDERDGELRYRLPETVRQYATERLRAAGEDAAIHARHRDFALAFAERLAPAVEGTAPAAALDTLEREHDNLRAALDWSLARGDAALALRLGTALWRFWRLRGYASEGRRWFGRALALGADAPVAVRAQALNAAGALAYSQGDHDQARPLVAESLALARELGDRTGVAGALGLLGMIQVAQGAHDEAMEQFEGALALWRALDQPLRAGMILNNLSVLANDRGEHARAEGYLAESLAIKRRLGDRHGSAVALHNLAESARLQGAYARAVALETESAALLRDLGMRHELLFALNGLGLALQLQGDTAGSAAHLAESLALAESIEDKMGIVLCLDGLALLAGSRGDAARAARLLAASGALREATGFTLPQSERAGHEAALAAARAALTPEQFSAAWTVGRALPVASALAEARAVIAAAQGDAPPPRA